MALIDIAGVFNAKVTDDIFLRFQSGCLITAKDIKSEEDTTPSHQDRLSWANAILQSSPAESYARVYKHLRYALATNTAFQQALDAVTDSDILFMIASNLNTLL